jgi:hypothetical protein
MINSIPYAKAVDKCIYLILCKFRIVKVLAQALDAKDHVSSFYTLAKGDEMKWRLSSIPPPTQSAPCLILAG